MNFRSDAGQNEADHKLMPNPSMAWGLREERIQ